MSSNFVAENNLSESIEKAINTARQVVLLSAEELVSYYRSELEKLRESGAVPGYVALQFGCRLLGNSLALRWYERHARGGRRGFRTIKRGKGLDYNLTTLLARAVPGTEALITEVEHRARPLRVAGKQLVKANSALVILQNRINEHHSLQGGEPATGAWSLLDRSLDLNRLEGGMTEGGDV